MEFLLLNVLIENVKEIKMKTRKELMQELNSLLNVNYNWSRLNLLDLTRLVTSIKKVK